MRLGEAVPSSRPWTLSAAHLAGALLLLLVTLGRTSHAQGVTTAALEGVVTGGDSALESAEVLVTHVATGERWRVSTSRAGRYGFEHLSPGPYRLEVRAIGFVPATRADVTLGLNTRTRVDVALAAQVRVLEPVVVTAQPDPDIGPERMGPERILTDSLLRRLPFRGRDFTGAIAVSPLAAVRPRPPFNNILDVSILGRNPRLTTLEIDGAAAGDFLGGVSAPDLGLGARPLAVEALQLLAVEPAPYDVRYGSSSAGTVQAITRSGTNRVEASASGYYTSRHLQRSDGIDLGPDNLTVGEGSMTLGGPIARDRAAFFLQAGLQRYAVPTNVPTIGTDTVGGADSVGIGFTQATARRLRQILVDHYGFDPGTADPYPLHVPAANVFAKITWQPRVNSRLELSHAYDGSTLDFLADPCRQAHDTYCLTGSHFVLPLRAHATRLAWTAAVGSATANELVLARRRYTKHCVSAEFPTVYVLADAGRFEAGANDVCGGDRDVQTMLELTDDVTLGLGAHRLTLGTHAERVRISVGEASVVPLRATWTFASLDDLAAGQASSYDAFAANPARASTTAVAGLASEQVALYAQDQLTWGRWRITAGLRGGVSFGLRLPTFNRTLLDSLGLDNRTTPATHVQWAPRAGVSYDVRGDGRLFLRGGMGWFGGRPPFGWFAEVYRRTGLDEVHIYCEGDRAPTFTPDLSRQPQACAGGGSDSLPGPVVLFERSFRSPSAFKASIGADARLPGDVIVTTDLIYTRGNAQLSLSDRNLAPAIGIAEGEAGRPLFGTIDSAGGVITTRRTGAFERVIALGSRSRDRSLALSVQAEKRLSAGATVSASYTYTDASDALSATLDNLDEVLESRTIASPVERSLRPTAWSAPHRVTVLVAADLPLHVAVSLFYTGESGSPFTYAVAGDANADGYLNDPVYLPVNPGPNGDLSLVVEDGVGGFIPASPSVYRQFGAFLHTQSCLDRQYGRLVARNSCRNPWRSETQARLARVVPLGSRSLTLTLDVFNLLNLISDEWGQVRNLSDPQVLRLVGYDPIRGRGVYVFQQPDQQADLSISRWRMLLGASMAF